jgi:hypothetical protein
MIGRALMCHPRPPCLLRVGTIVIQLMTVCTLPIKKKLFSDLGEMVHGGEWPAHNLQSGRPGFGTKDRHSGNEYCYCI